MEKVINLVRKLRGYILPNNLRLIYITKNNSFFYIFDVFNLIFLQFVKGINKVKNYVIAGIISTVVTISLNIILLVIVKIGLVGYLISYIGGQVSSIVFLVISCKIWKYLLPYKKTDKKVLKNMMNFSIPMIPNSISWWISNSSDKYMLSYFTTLSTENYLPGVIALNQALKNVHSKYPLYALLSNEISEVIEEKLNKKGIKTIRREKVDLPQEIIDRNRSRAKNRWNYTFDKLNIFELTDFEKIVFIDSDIYVRQNIDSLFDKPHMSAVIDKHYGPNLTCRCLELTSGVIVVEPRKGQIEKFKEIIKTIIDKRDAIGDQDILQEYDHEWKNKPELHLKNKYNIFFPYLEYYVNFQEYSMDDLAVIHQRNLG